MTLARRRSIGLLALAVLALAPRLVLVGLLAHAGHVPYAYEHGVIAENLATGRGFVIEFLGSEGPTSQQGPLYPAALAIFYRLFGVGSNAALVTMQLVQCLAASVTAVCVALLGWSWFPRYPIAGWLAGLVAALHPTHIYAVTHIQVVVWVTMLLAVMLVLVSAPAARHRIVYGIGAGLAAGALVLCEPILALAVPPAVLLYGLRHGNGDHVIQSLLRVVFRAALVGGVCAAVLAPWIGRNWHVHRELVFVKSTFGYAFWQGNNPLSQGTDKIPTREALADRRAHDGTVAQRLAALQESRLAAHYIDDVALTSADYTQLSVLGEPARSRELGRRARQFITDNPSAYVRLCLQRLRYFLLFDQTNPKAADPIYKAMTVSWLIVASVGLLASLRHWRVLWPAFVIFAAVTLFHTLTITSVRFRLPIEPLSFVWTAAAFAPALQHVIAALPAPRWAAPRRDATPQPQLHTLPDGAAPAISPAGESPYPPLRKAG